MHKIAISTALAVILVFSAISAITISNVYAKMQPSGKPDISLGISFQKGTSPDKFQRMYDDIGKVDRIFDTVFLPVIDDFLEKHGKKITNEYLDGIQIRYDGDANQIIILFRQAQDGMHEIINIDPEPYVSLEIVDSFYIEIPVSMQFYYEGEQGNSLRYILPNASTRVGYLSSHMQDLMTKYQNEITKEYFRSIWSFMLDDMSKTTINLNSRQIVEYNTGIDLVLANPISALRVPEFFTNSPISIVKSSNYPLTVRCTSPEGDVAKMTLNLSYPDGEKSSINSTLIHDPSVGYKAIELTLDAVEPEGLYKLVLSDAEPEKRVYCSVNVNRESGQDRPFEYVDSLRSQEPVLDRAWVAYRNETWCNYSRLMTVESPDATIFHERTGSWITIYEWLNQYGEFESSWSNVHFDNTNPTYFLHAVKWRENGSPDGINNAMQAFNSLSPDMKKGKELSLYLIEGDCISAEGREFAVETETSYNIEAIRFIQQEKKIMYAVDTGETVRGLFEVTIPKELLYGDFTVMVDGKPHYITESVAGSTNDTHTTLTYWHEGSARNIEVIGTEAIPEFPFALIVLAGSIAGFIASSRWIQRRNPHPNIG